MTQAIGSTRKDAARQRADLRRATHSREQQVERLRDDGCEGTRCKARGEDKRKPVLIYVGHLLLAAAKRACCALVSEQRTVQPIEDQLKRDELAGCVRHLAACDGQETLEKRTDALCAHDSRKRTRQTAEQIILKLKTAEQLIAQGKTVVEVCSSCIQR